MEMEEVLQKTRQAPAPNHSQPSYFHCLYWGTSFVGDTTLAKTPHSITYAALCLCQVQGHCSHLSSRMDSGLAEGESEQRGIKLRVNLMGYNQVIPDHASSGHCPGTGVRLVPTHPHQYLPFRSITGTYFETSRSQHVSKQKRFLYCLHLLTRNLSQVTPVRRDGRLSLEEVLQLRIKRQR